MTSRLLYKLGQIRTNYYVNIGGTSSTTMLHWQQCRFSLVKACLAEVSLFLLFLWEEISGHVGNESAALGSIYFRQLHGRLFVAFVKLISFLCIQVHVEKTVRFIHIDSIVKNVVTLKLLFKKASPVEKLSSCSKYKLYIYEC